MYYYYFSELFYYFKIYFKIFIFRLAEEALLKEAKRGAERAEVYGPSGWLKPKVAPTNKRFLHNMLSGKICFIFQKIKVITIRSYKIN